MNKLKCKVCGKERVIIYGRAMKCCDTVQYLPPEPKEEYAECPNCGGRLVVREAGQWVMCLDCGAVASGGRVTWIKEMEAEGNAPGLFPKYGKSIIEWARELEEKENEKNQQD